jgi:two-component sensor histidine kinase
LTQCRSRGKEKLSLPRMLATSLGLVLHERVTSSSKYVVLSSPQVVVELTWEARATRRSGGLQT